MAATQSIAFFNGENVTLNGVLNPVVDITSWAMQFAVRGTAGGTAIITKTVGSGITIVSGPASTFTVVLLSADTATQPPGAYVYDLQRTDSGHHTELLTGTLTLTAPVSPITPP